MRVLLCSLYEKQMPKIKLINCVIVAKETEYVIVALVELNIC